MRQLVGAASIAAVSGCTPVFNGVSDALDVNGLDQRLAFSTTTAQPGGGGDTSAIKGVAMGAGEPTLFRAVYPFDDRLTFVEALAWDSGGDRLAVQVHEVIPGGEFDKWIFLYDRALEVDFRRSDDTLASDMTRDCMPIATTIYQDLVDEGVLAGALPAGSTVKFTPGSGLVLGAAFEGWLTDTSFAIRLENEPDAFIEEPGGIVNTSFLASAGLSGLGSVIDLYGTYTLNGSQWALTACSEFAPIVPPRGAPLQDVTISDGSVGAEGDLLLDGAPLLNASGNPVAGEDGAEQLDGPY